MSINTNNILSSQDIEIYAVNILSATAAPIDLKSGDKKFNNIVIYENIFDKYIHGHMQIIDASGISMLAGLNGNEFVEIIFFKPGENENSKRYAKYFRIYKVDEREPMAKSQGQSYVIHFCSEEAVFSDQLTISRTFKGETASKYIYGICKNDLKIGSDRLNLNNFENSYGITNIALPACKPMEAIDFFTAQAFSGNDSAFVFFENRNGYNFVSLETLFSSQTVMKLKYNTVKFTEDRTTGPFVNANDITTFNLKAFDVLNNVKKSTYAGTLYTLDLIRQKYTRNPYSLLNASNKLLLDGNYPLKFTKNRNEKSAYEEFGTNIKYSITNYGQTSAPYLRERGYNVIDTNIEKTLLQRESQLQLLKNTMLKVNIPANPLLTVGQVVEFDMPSFTANQESTKLFDLFYSGKYLIAEVKHTLIPSGKMMTSLGLCKNSTGRTHVLAAENTAFKKARNS